ncbi:MULTISPECIES: hypothetical protein [Actinoalloteichus]|nr:MULTISPECIES: hypothetical protein [Actinoalloteichus]
MSIVDKEPSISVQIAHINGLNPGSARYDPLLTVPQRNSFGNLILLCSSHHGPVDDKSKEQKYPKALLIEWKRAREGDYSTQLAGLDVLGKRDLEEILGGVVVEAKEDIANSINELAKISQSAAESLRELVRESFERPYLDYDAVGILAESASYLRHLPDSAEMLLASAGELRKLEDNVGSLNMAVENFMEMQPFIKVLKNASEEMAESSYVADRVREAREELEGTSVKLTSLASETRESVALMERSGGPIIHQYDNGKNWKYFKAGVIVGAIIVGILVYFAMRAFDGSP